MTERMVEVADGVRLCVDVSGAGEPLVLVHGAGCSLVAWPDGLVDLLGRRHRVLRYDARDQGRSTTWPVGEPGYGMSDVVADVLALLDDEGVPSAHVLGVSGGGMVGQLLALDHPARVATLTLVSSTPGSADLPGMSDDLRTFFDGGADEPDWADREAVVTYLTELERPFQRGGFDEALQRVIAVRTERRSNDLRAATTNPFLVDPGPPWRDRLSDLAAPTLVVHGADDPLFPLAHGEALAREIPDAELVVFPDAGHGVPPRRAWPELVARVERLTNQSR
ncbi:alpha/beta fold hydrolase [Cellulomonas sp. Leaf334]|uniref:alpha/beta fold hydrolase n=1 Tax=Cellulomonas sp. Leaf334 TaxID=1736339 RepID=UPI000B268865|nr:alpha/beta hydrolase [Cellulomonas sp. Leaf334]